MVEQIVERERRTRVEVPGDTLVVLGVRDVVETLARHLLHRDVSGARLLEDLGQPRFGTDRSGDHDLARAPPGAKCLEHRVAAVEDVHAVTRVAA